jgi:predicted transcriptional regulator
MSSTEKPTAKKDLVVSGDQAVKVADALTATTMKMMQLLSKEPLDVSTIGKKLGLSQAYISEQVKLLEGLGLLDVSYARGKRGIRKICSTSIERVTLLVKES